MLSGFKATWNNSIRKNSPPTHKTEIRTVQRSSFFSKRYENSFVAPTFSAFGKKSVGRIFPLRHGGHHHDHDHDVLLHHGQHNQDAVRISWVGLASNVLMAGGKGVVGVVIPSQK